MIIGHSKIAKILEVLLLDIQVILFYNCTSFIILVMIGKKVYYLQTLSIIVFYSWDIGLKRDVPIGTIII